MSDSVMEVIRRYSVTPGEQDNPLVSMVRQGMVRFLVGKRMTCPITGRVLDYRTCLILVDRDQDPVDVYAPELVEVLQQVDAGLLTKVLDATGYRFDARSVERLQQHA